MAVEHRTEQAAAAATQSASLEEAVHSACGARPREPDRPTRKPPREIARRPARPAQYPDQRPIPNLFCVAQWQRARRGSDRLPLTRMPTGGNMPGKAALIHPGEILLTEFMQPLGLTAY